MASSRPVKETGWKERKPIFLGLSSANWMMRPTCSLLMPLTMVTTGTISTTARLNSDGVVEHLLNFRPRQLMHEADLIGVHEAGVAHHVAAVGQVNGQHRAAAVFHRRRSVVMQLLVVVGANVAAREYVFQML